jgi:hypothetical protein
MSEEVSFRWQGSVGDFATALVAGLKREHLEQLVAELGRLLLEKQNISGEEMAAARRVACDAQRGAAKLPELPGPLELWGMGIEARLDELERPGELAERLRALEEKALRAEKELFPGGRAHTAPLAERVGRIEVERARDVLARTLVAYVTASKLDARETGRYRYEAARRAFVGAYGEAAWRAAFDAIVEDYHLDDYIFDLDALRGEEDDDG